MNLEKKVCLGIEGLGSVFGKKKGENFEMFYGGVEVCPRKKCIDKYSQIKQAQARGKQWDVKKVKKCTFTCRSKVWNIFVAPTLSFPDINQGSHYLPESNPTRL